MDKQAILKKFAFFEQVPSRLKAEMERTGALAELPKGAFYFHEGDRCTQIALLGEGRIRVYKIGESGRQITLYHVEAGETCILTASCVLAGVEYPASALVETPAKAVAFPAATFRDWVGRYEPVREFVFEILARRMATVMSVVEEIAFNKMDRRLAEYLLRRFDNNGRPLRVLHTTHEQIASELGSAREVISRLLKELERNGAIQLSRERISLRDKRALRQAFNV